MSSVQPITLRTVVNRRSRAKNVKESGGVAKPFDVLLHPDGLVYASNHGQHSIIKIDVEKSEYEIHAGNEVNGDSFFATPSLEANFRSPRGITVGSRGEIYVTDFRNCRIKIIEDGMVSPFAGSGTAGSQDNPDRLQASFNHPYWICFNLDYSILYVSDTVSQKIRAISMEANGGVTSIGRIYPYTSSKDGSYTNCQFNSPKWVSIARGEPLDIHTEVYGFCFVSENGRIRKIDPLTQSVTTYAGTGHDGSQDGPLASATLGFEIYGLFAPNGDLYISDRTAQGIRKITPTEITTIISSQDSSEQHHLDWPAGLCWYGNGDLIICDCLHDSIKIATNVIDLSAYKKSKFMTNTSNLLSIAASMDGYSNSNFGHVISGNSEINIRTSNGKSNDTNIDSTFTHDPQNWLLTKSLKLNSNCEFLIPSSLLLLLIPNLTSSLDSLKTDFPEYSLSQTLFFKLMEVVCSTDSTLIVSSFNQLDRSNVVELFVVLEYLLLNMSSKHDPTDQDPSTLWFFQLFSLWIRKIKSQEQLELILIYLDHTFKNYELICKLKITHIILLTHGDWKKLEPLISTSLFQVIKLTFEHSTSNIHSSVNYFSFVPSFIQSKFSSLYFSTIARKDLKMVHFVPSHVLSNPIYIKSYSLSNESSKGLDSRNNSFTSDIIPVQIFQIVPDQIQCNFALSVNDGKEPFTVHVHDWIVYTRWRYMEFVMNAGMMEVSNRKIELSSLHFPNRSSLSKFVLYLYTGDYAQLLESQEAMTALMTGAKELMICDFDGTPYPEFSALFPKTKSKVTHP